MQFRVIKSDLLLLLTAAIWGFAFVAQRAGNAHIGPFLYNSLRFGLGCLVLFPLVMLKKPLLAPPNHVDDVKLLLKGGLFAGIFLFLGATLQQTGLVTTTAGKAGFITGLYVVIVPIFAIIWRQKVPLMTWIGAILAAVGLYFLSVKSGFSIIKGDLLVLIGSFVWGGHVLIIGRYSPKLDPVKLAFIQFALTSLLSSVASFIFEWQTVDQVLAAWLPIVYGGVMSAGIAFTLQVIAQRDAPASHAAIIMSLETVFAAFGGWLILHEILTPRDLIGCTLMLIGMIVSQFYRIGNIKKAGLYK